MYVTLSRFKPKHLHTIPIQWKKAIVPQIFHSSSPEETSQQAKNRHQLGIENIVLLHNSFLHDIYVYILTNFYFRIRRIRQKNGITAFPQLNRLSDFMIAKEEKNRKPCNEVELTCNGFDSDSSDTNSLSSSLSNRSSVDNSGKPLNDSFSGDEDKANHKNESLLVSKLGSCNRKRRSSFLTGNLNSPFRNTSFVSVLPKEVVIPNNVLLPNKNTSKINSSEKYDYLRSDIEAKSNASKVSDIKKGKGNGLDMTRIPSQGSDMSLTLMSCEENGEENILNQVHTTPNTAIPNIDANEIVMEDSDHMFTEALTQAPDESEKNSSVEMESDSDDMFTQALTQSQCQSNKHDKNKSDEDSYNMFSQVDSQVIFPPKTATPQFLNMYRKETVNRADSMESEESIPQKEDNTLLESLLSGKNHTAKNKYQPPSFQNFSSDSAKAAMLQVATELSNKENRNLAIVTADTDDEIKKVSSDALDVDENEELAVSIMTQAYSERLSEGLELTSNHQLEEVENEELPATQPSSLFILQGTLVFVEVRTGSENRSACVISRLESMGANISENLTSRCTHLIFKDGSLSIYNKAKKLGIHIVSVTWIEACRNDGTRLPEANYPCSNVERYENPGLFPKLRKAKSMQPKDPDEFMRTVELRLDRREKAKQRTAEKLKAKEQAEKERLYNPFTYRVRHPLPDHYYNSPTLNDSKHKGDKKYDVLEMLEEASISSPMLPVPNRPKPISATKDDNIGLSPDKRHSNTCSKTLSNGEMLPGALTPSPCTSDDLNTPFLKRLADRINRRSLADHNSKHTPSYTPQMSNLQEQYSRQDAESKETQSAGPEASVNDPDDIMDQIHTKIDHNSLDNSLNPSPIASKSFFVQEINSKRLENITEISHTHQYLKSPKQIRRLRSNCGSIPESHLSEKKYAKAKQIENSSVVAPKQISVEVSKEVSPSKGIIRTRSNRGKILEKPSLQKQNRNTTSHQGNRDESSKKKIKRRHMLFSEKASLLAETPPGSSAELVIQVPSNSKHIPKIQCKGRKSMAGQTSTKIIRSESGSLLYAQPPKSMAIVNRRQSIRLKERPPFKGKINKENFNGSYENVKDDLAENIKKSRAKRTILPPRRSTAEFESPRGSVTRKLSSVRINPKPQIEEIVCTSCSKEDIDLAKQLSKEFGPKDVISSQSSNGASSQSSNPSSSRLTRGKARPRALSVKVNGKVTTTTTHVICGYSSGKDANSQCSKVGTTDERNQMSVRRTMNVLKGILHGCWILSKDWLYASVDAGHWVEEDMYELVDFSPAVRSTRLAREAFSSPAYGLRFQSVSSRNANVYYPKKA